MLAQIYRNRRKKTDDAYQGKPRVEPIQRVGKDSAHERMKPQTLQAVLVQHHFLTRPRRPTTRDFPFDESGCSSTSMSSVSMGPEALLRSWSSSSISSACSRRRFRNPSSSISLDDGWPCIELETLADCCCGRDCWAWDHRHDTGSRSATYEKKFD